MSSCATGPQPRSLPERFLLGRLNDAPIQKSVSHRPNIKYAAYALDGLDGVAQIVRMHPYEVQPMQHLFDTYAIRRGCRMIEGGQECAGRNVCLAPRTRVAQPIAAPAKYPTIHR